MPNFSLKQQPQYPIKVIDTGSPISAEQLYAALDGTNAVTLCVRTASGHEKRGGHFFCIRKMEELMFACTPPIACFTANSSVISYSRVPSAGFLIAVNLPS